MPKPLAVVPDLEDELDRLFALAPGEFTSARNDLARRLKQAGQNAIAARVRELKKPTLPTWTVNQLARRHAKDLQALLEAGEELRSAQEEAFGGGDSAKLRAATAAERQTLRTLTQKASKILAGEGHSPTPAVLDRVASTLRTAILDPDTRELLVAGRLTEELEATGFGALEGMRTAARPARSARSEPKKRVDTAAERRRKERLRKLRERSTKLAADAEEAAREAERAAATAERARRKAERSSALAERARAELEAAEQDTDE